MRAMLKRAMIVIFFMAMGIIFSYFTKKYYVYLPSSLIVGILITNRIGGISQTNNKKNDKDKTDR